MNLFGDLTPLQKLTKARVNLNDNKPFFGYLTMRLVFHVEKDNEVQGRMGVDMYGNCIYNPKFVESLPQNEVEGVLCHEVMHCALKHLERVGGKDRELWNISADIVINALIKIDGMTPPRGGYNPDHNGDIKVFGDVDLHECHKKSANEVYEKLYEKWKKHKGPIPEGFDVHIYDSDKGNNNGGKGKNKNNNNNQIDWEKELVEATTFAKMQGHLPAGMRRLVDELLGNTIDWRGLLYKYIQNTLPFDYTWIKPNKKSYATGIYMPDIVREKIDIICDIDTSGSISAKELQEFSSELLGIINSFENVDLTIIYNDTEVYGPHKLRNPSPDDIKRLKPEGGGGTNHIPVFEWIDKNEPQAKLLIAFTDGYTSFPKKSNIDTIWVLGGYHCDKKDIPFGRVIELPKDM